jgi:hypothetical protein
MPMKNRNSYESICMHAITFLSWEIKKLGLFYQIQEDPKEMNSFLRKNNYIVNPTFDNEKLNNDEILWIGVRDQDGNIVGCHAEKLFWTTDFIKNQISSGLLWGESAEKIKLEDMKFSDNYKIHGIVSYAGSMFIEHQFRNKNLSFIIPHLSRAVIFIKYRNNFCTGIVRENLASTNLPRKNYGFTHVDFLYHGKLPGSSLDSENVYLCWMNQYDLVKSMAEVILRRERAALTENRDGFFIPDAVNKLIINMIF